MSRLTVCRPFLTAAFVVAAAFTLLSPRTAHAQVGQWGQWENFGNGISVSFCQVTDTIYTWKFRNDTGRTLVAMSFNITDDDGTHGDMIPSPLSPGQAFGGWSAYTANVHPGHRVMLTLTSITFQ